MTPTLAEVGGGKQGCAVRARAGAGGGRGSPDSTAVPTCGGPWEAQATLQSVLGFRELCKVDCQS